jgi:hypothetical protein
MHAASIAPVEAEGPTSSGTVVPGQDGADASGAAHMLIGTFAAAAAAVALLV